MALDACPAPKVQVRVGALIDLVEPNILPNYLRHSSHSRCDRPNCRDLPRFSRGFEADSTSFVGHGVVPAVLPPFSVARRVLRCTARSYAPLGALPAGIVSMPNWHKVAHFVPHR
jgi:hypothetical protein